MKQREERIKIRLKIIKKMQNYNKTQKKEKEKDEMERRRKSGKKRIQKFEIKILKNG